MNKSRLMLLHHATSGIEPVRGDGRASESIPKIASRAFRLFILPVVLLISCLPPVSTLLLDDPYR